MCVCVCVCVCVCSSVVCVCVSCGFVDLRANLLPRFITRAVSYTLTIICISGCGSHTVMVNELLED